MKVAIHHNPACGTSRNVLRLLRAGGHEVAVIRYLDAGWTRPQLTALFAAAGIGPREALRVRGTRAAALGLDAPGTAEEAILDAMLLDPILVNRPFVCTPKGVRLCRPSETVLDLIDTWPPGPFAKEDGTAILDAAGNRVG